MSPVHSPDPQAINKHSKIPLDSTNQDAGLEPTSEKTSQLEFPDGGARAWSVAAACAGILFCTFGYVNSFG
jgi:hypothetical protein